MADAPHTRLIGSLLALVAHDLRNPLSALHSNIGFIESVTDEKDRDAREALADVVASCNSLRHIVDNLELFGLFVQGQRPELERSPMALVDVVNDVVGRLRGVAESYGVTLELGEARRDVRVRAHREMFSRSLANIVFNCVQHGGSSSPITLDVTTDGKHGVVVCSDAGAPLAEELRVDAFTAEGQLTCKNDAFGRYSRGLGLLAARVAADMAGVHVEALPPAADKNRFELRAPLA